MKLNLNLIGRVVSYVILALFTTSVFTSCAVSKTGRTEKPGTGYIYTFPRSPQATQFAAMLNEEIAPARLSDGFIPSDALISRFGLEKNSVGYILNGIIKTDDTFDIGELKKIGVETSPSKGRLMTVRIPLAGFVAFLQQSGIVYFDLAKAVHPRMKQ